MVLEVARFQGIRLPLHSLPKGSKCHGSPLIGTEVMVQQPLSGLGSIYHIATWTLWARNYCGGWNNYQYHGPILLIWLWCQTPQIDLNMILVILFRPLQYLNFWGFWSFACFPQSLAGRRRARPILRPGQRLRQACCSGTREVSCFFSPLDPIKQ